MNNEIVQKLIKKNMRTCLSNIKSERDIRKIKLYEILNTISTTNTPKNIREIYYIGVNIFKNQNEVNNLIEEIEKKSGITREIFGIKNTQKGIFYGEVTFLFNNGNVLKTKNIVNLIPEMSEIKKISYTYQNIMVIEKDTAFSRITRIVRNKRIKTLLVCGKGYPCRNTLMFLKMINESTKIYGLFDFDPFGLHIYTIYKYGSSKSILYRIESITRIGITSADIIKFKINKFDLINLNDKDMKKIEHLEKYRELKEDLEFMMGLEKKMEIESLLNNNLYANYLMKKIIL